MSDYQNDIPEMEKIQTKIDWTTVTKEGNKFCQSLNKIIKANNTTGKDNRTYVIILIYIHVQIYKY